MRRSDENKLTYCTMTVVFVFMNLAGVCAQEDADGSSGFHEK